jgi:hypothetical protein
MIRGIWLKTVAMVIAAASLALVAAVQVLTYWQIKMQEREAGQIFDGVCEIIDREDGLLTPEDSLTALSLVSKASFLDSRYEPARQFFESLTSSYEISKIEDFTSNLKALEEQYWIDLQYSIETPKGLCQLR